MNRWFDKFPILSKYFSGKIILSILLVLLSIILLAIFQTVDRLFCVFAMLFSFGGDYALNHQPKDKSISQKRFIAGGLSFIISHAFYCIAYCLKIQANGFALFNLGTVFAALILSIITVIFALKAGNNILSKLFEFGIAYLWITGIDYAVIFSYSFSVKSIESLALIGGLSFLASDVLIGCEKLLELKSKTARELIWWLYPIGQILLIIMA